MSEEKENKNAMPESSAETEEPAEENAQLEETAAEDAQPEENVQKDQETEPEEDVRPEEGPERLTPETVQREIARTRHTKELPLYIACIIMGVIGSMVVLARSFQGEGLIEQIKEMVLLTTHGDPGATAAALWVILTIVGFLMGVGSVIGLIVLIIVTLYQLYGQQLSYSVRVSEKNYPEIYEKVKEYSYLLGIKEPEVYVQQSNGALNAFTAWIPGKTFIQLNAEIVDIAYMENKDFDTVNFVMAHEFGHVYLHHVQLMYQFWSTLVNFVPFIGNMIMAPLLSRAREYSADRVGQALTGGKSERECMMLLAAGRHGYKHITAEQYIEDMTTTHNWAERLARWVTNLMASHPIMPYRTQAILDPEKKSGKLL